MAFITNGTTVATGGSLQNVPAPSSSQVGSGIAGLSPNDVGSFGLAQYNTSGVAVSVGNTTAGSGLRWANANGNIVTSPSLSGTWKSTGPALNSGNALQRTVLYYRVS